MFQDEEESFLADADGVFSDDEPPKKRRKSVSVRTPRGSVRKEKLIPRYKQRLADSSVSTVPVPSSDVSILSQMERDPQFYTKLAAAVRPFACLYNRFDQRFRTNAAYREECWTSVAKNAGFIGSPQETEAEWRCVENNYRKWRLQKAKKRVDWDEDMEDVFNEMKWIDRGLVSWVEKSPLMVTLASLHEKYVERVEYPSRRRRTLVADTSDVFDVPEKEPEVSPVRQRRSLGGRRPSAIGSLIEFPKATPQKKDGDLEITSRLKKSLRKRTSTTVDEESGMSPRKADVSAVFDLLSAEAGSRASAVFDLTATAASPDKDWSERSCEF